VDFVVLYISIAVEVDLFFFQIETH
jgi:hypothetical protein